MTLRRNHFPFSVLISLAVLIVVSTSPVAAESFADARNLVDVTDAISTETTHLAGDRYDSYWGTLHFTQTDVSIPGNSDLKVEVRRLRPTQSETNHYQGLMMDWDLDVPIIFRDKTKMVHPINPSLPGFTTYSELRLRVDGQQKLLYSLTNNAAPGMSYPSGAVYKTTDHWIVKSLGSIGGGQIGYLVIAPNGDEYHFNKYVEVSTSNYVHRPMQWRQKWKATQIKDRHGNWVRYNYNTAGDQLNSIQANDGRLISFSYLTVPTTRQDALGNTIRFVRTRYISTASANGRTWTYRYDPLHLQRITRPDNKHHQFAPDDQLVINYWNYQVNNNVNFTVDKHFVVNHPDGARVEFTFKAKWGCMNRFLISPPANFETCAVDPANASAGYAYIVPRLFLSDKEITLGSGQGLSWQYALTHGASHPGTGPTYSKTRTIREVGANGQIDYTHSQERDETDGASLSTRWRTPGGSLLRQEAYTHEWVRVLSNPNCTSRGCYSSPPNFPALAAHDPQLFAMKKYYKSRIKSISTLQAGSTFTREILTYNKYDEVELTKETNSVSSAQRYTRQGYQHDTTHWIINLPTIRDASTNNLSWTEVDRITYHPWSASGGSSLKPRHAYSFGRLIRSHVSYHGDGNARRTTFGSASRWVEFESYKRGRPQTIRFPARYSSSVNSMTQEINNDGTVKSRTDGNGHKTNFQYDTLQRLTLIDPVDSRWSNTTITYRGANSSDPGTYAGQLTQVRRQGNYEKSTYYDSLLRPVLVRERDLSNVSQTTRYEITRYDANGNVSFRSYPSTQHNETKGTEFEHDMLNRRTAVLENTGNARTRYSYLSGNRVRIVDFRGKTTTTTYRAYGEPTQESPLRIDSPEGVVTQLTYNLFDQIQTIQQGTQTSRLIYDGNQRLCKLYQPETGWHYMDYNSAGEISWEARGISSSSSACDRGIVPAGAKITNVYDNQGSLRTVSYGDGTPNVTYERDIVGNLTKLTHGNRVWTYTYNSLDLVETERLAVGSKVFLLDPSYNALGQPSSLKYPSGGTVTFQNNALGQTSGVTGYVNSATYHPTGTLKMLRYANGVTYSTTLTARQQPYDMDILGPSNQRLSDLRFGYDANGNITSILDYRDNTYNLSMQYDGLNRLTAANGYWGTGGMTYDALGNLLTKTLGSQSLTYQYTSGNRLNRVTGSKSYQFSYDVRGNVTNNGHRSFSYNLANQLGSSDGITYQYDGHGRRVSKTSGGSTEYAVYGMDGTLYYRQKANGTHVDYVYMDGDLIAKNDNGQKSYVHTDVLGSPILVTNSSGAVAKRTHYKPFGETQSTPTEDIGYTGHLEDPDLGLTYMQARYYDPVLGRFYASDPVGYRDVHSFNRYVYGNNNPYHYVDPTGEIPVLVPVAVFLAKEVAAELASRATNGATDFLSVRRLGTRAVKFGAERLAKDRTAGATWRSADGRLRDDKGRFAYDGGSKSRTKTDGQHGNTRTDKTQATLYAKLDKDGNFLKWGVSQDPQKRYTRNQLDGGRVRRYRTGPRDEMLDRERKLVERFPGPENREPWAGSRVPHRETGF